MKTLRTCLLLCCLLLSSISVVPVAAQVSPVKKRLDAYLSALSDDAGMNGSVVIVDNGKVIYKRSFGYLNFETKTPHSNETLYPLASISKTFTAIAVLQLVEKEKLRLDDPLAKYLTNFPYPDITIRQLLSHTSGLPDSEAIYEPLLANDSNKIFTTADVIPALAAYKQRSALLFSPGNRWGYSSVGFQLLVLLVEKISDEPFAEYLERHVFRPVGMTRTYVQTSLRQTREANRTVNYQYNNHYEMKLLKMEDQPDWKEWTYNLTGLMGGNNVVSTAEDLVKYDRVLYTSKLLRRSTLEEAFSPAKLANGEENKAISGYSTGLGWFVANDISNGKIVQHSGANPGVSTLILRNISKRQCVIILQNVQSREATGDVLMKILNGSPVTYKRSAAFAYARDVYSRGAEFALARFQILKKDTENYTFVESEMDRVGLEFSRNPKMQAQSLEAYRLNTELFPESWSAFNNYGAALWKTGRKDDAKLMLKKSLELNPKNESAQKLLAREP